MFGNILEAKLFDTMKDAFDFILSRGSEYYLGCSVMLIADCTLEVLRKEMEDFEREPAPGKLELYKKMHDPLYAVR